MESKRLDDAGRPIEVLRFTVTKGSKKKAKPGEVHVGSKRLEQVILPQLREALDASPSGHMTCLVREWGKPFTAAGFGNWFRERCNEAGLSQCSAHGIQKFDATLAAEEGMTTHQLMGEVSYQPP